MAELLLLVTFWAACAIGPPSMFAVVYDKSSHRVRSWVEPDKDADLLGVLTGADEDITFFPMSAFSIDYREIQKLVNFHK
jgi:hypothetical protein